jgi:D-alanine-D-alanine ligase
MRVGILFNQPEALTEAEEQDRLAVLDDLEAVCCVETALAELGHTPRRIALGQDLQAAVRQLTDLQPDVVFNLCEAFRGQSLLVMQVPALLEVLEVPYTGNSSQALGLSTDKALAKAVLAAQGLAVPPHAVLATASDASSVKLPFPLIVKPLCEDGSYGVTAEAVVSSPATLEQRASFVLERFRQPALVEAFVDGREINAPLVGHAPPSVLPLSEIDFVGFPASLPRICGYDAKWVAESFEFQHTISVCPADLPDHLASLVRAASMQAYQVLGCRDYARVDFRLDANGTPYLLEVNANPAITPDAGFTRSWLALGRTYPQLIASLLDFALSRKPVSRRL